MGDQAEPVHRHEDAVDAGKGNPEMEFAERFVQAAAKKFGEPEKQCAKNGKRGRDAHDEMEMTGDEIVADGSSGEIVAGEENPGESAGEKKRNKTEREKHGSVELDARVPQRAEPTDQKDGGGQSEGRSQKREDQWRKRVHAAGKHVLAPDAKTEDAHAAQRQHNEAFLPNRLAGKCGNQMRDEAERRKHGDVNFGLGKKPEEALPEDGNSSCGAAARLTGEKTKRREKVRAQEAIRQQAGASRKK